MKVEVSKAVVTSAIGSQDLMKLHQLLIFACEGRHVVLFDSHDALNACLNTFEPGCRSIYGSLLAQMGRSAAHLPADVATIRIDNDVPESWNDPLAILSLDRAVVTLAEPLGILVENAENDWFFLLGIMRPSERRKMICAVKKGWVRPLHGGGSNLESELPRRLASPEKGLRTFLLFDSDRRHPEELDPAWAPTAPEACQGFNVQKLLPSELKSRHWMLKRRFIESYMPEIEMKKAVSANIHSDAVNAFFRMGVNARWYFNMKKGFKGDDPVENRHRCRDLYDNVNAADRDALNVGFGRTLADQYQQALFTEFNWDAEARQEALVSLPMLMRLL